MLKKCTNLFVAQMFGQRLLMVACLTAPLTAFPSTLEETDLSGEWRLVCTTNADVACRMDVPGDVHSAPGGGV